eukprot:g33939.t1
MFHFLLKITHVDRIYEVTHGIPFGGSLVIDGKDSKPDKLSGLGEGEENQDDDDDDEEEEGGAETEEQSGNESEMNEHEEE